MTTMFEEKFEMLQEKFFSFSSQTDINNIANSFIFLTMLFNSHIFEKKIKQTIKRIKANKA